MSSTLMIHAGGVRRTRAELSELTTPEGSRTWKPVPHAELVGAIHEGLAQQGVRVAREQYATAGRGDVRLFGTLDLIVPGTSDGDFGMALGLSGANDKSMAIRLVAAARVFVCDNLALSGSGGAVCLARKHTSGLDLAKEVPHAIEESLDRLGKFRLDLEEMKDTGLTDDTAKAVIYDAFAGSKPVLPVRLFPEVGRLYFDDDRQRAMFPDRSLWSLSNAMTQAIKELRPVQQHSYGLRIGRHFARVLRHLRPEEIN